MSARLCIGCMTGTSIDALDAALVEVEGRGLEMKTRLVRARSWPLDELGVELRAIAHQEPQRAEQIADIAWRFGEFHARCTSELLGRVKADLVCVHGQTVFHKPPLSWQLINPAPIAAALRAPVVYDLRQADLAAGGQGAPITPLADWVLFRDARQSRAVVNLGGFCNITLLPAGGGPETVRGMDVCVCNQLLDAVARAALDAPFDDGGAAALAGTPNDAAVLDLAAVLERQSRSGRSLGTGDEAPAWISRHRASLSGPDLAASACAAIARTIAAAATSADALILAGGGVRNRALVGALEAQTKGRTQPSDDLGVPAPFREAIEFAVLGALCQDRVPITLAAVTGCGEPAPVSGCWILP